MAQHPLLWLLCAAQVNFRGIGLCQWLLPAQVCRQLAQVDFWGKGVLAGLPPLLPKVCTVPSCGCSPTNACLHEFKEFAPQPLLLLNFDLPALVPGFCRKAKVHAGWVSVYLGQSISIIIQEASNAIERGCTAAFHVHFF